MEQTSPNHVQAIFRPCTTSHKSLSSFCHKQRPADEGQRGEEPVGLDVEAEHELEVGRPVGHEGEGAEAGRHVRQHEGRERHRRRHRLPGNGQGVRLVALLKINVFRIWTWICFW